MEQLIKLSSDHYIIVDDSYIEMDDYYLDDTNTVKCAITEAESYWTHRKHYKKVTHSTQPLGFLQEEGITTANLKLTYGSVQQLSLSEVKELLGEVDVEKKANDYGESIGNKNGTASFDWKRGYNQALEDNKDRKYTEQDIRFTYMQGYNRGKDSNPNHMESYIKHLQPKTSWDIEFVNGKLKLK